MHGINSFPSLRLFTPATSADVAEDGAADATTQTEEERARAADAKSAKEPEVAPTLPWASYDGADFTADALAAWVRAGAAASAAARVVALRGDTFASVVLDSPRLWLVLFVARGVNWCPACAPVEAALRRLSASLAADADTAALNISFGVLDCETAAAVCTATGGLGRPYTHATGDFPQLLGYPAGRYKAAPGKLLQSHPRYIEQLTDRVGSLDAVLRVALGAVPAWARVEARAGAAGWGGAAGGGERAVWTRHVDAAAGRAFYYNTRTRVSSWDPPFGWDAAGADSQELGVPPPPPQEPAEPPPAAADVQAHAGATPGEAAREEL
jgi:hypothetical protein